MEHPPGALARRLAGALLLSLAFHAMVILNMKPTSARYAAGKPLRVHLALIDPGSVAPLRAPATDAPAPESPKPEGTTDSSLAKNFLDRADTRRGNLPDGRSAQFELDLPLLRQYLTAREVDQRATPLDDVPLVDTPSGLRPGQTGKVILLLLINENGGIDSIATLEARPPGMFEAMARSAFASVRYSPALKGGKPVKSQKIVEIVYGS
jgi:Gram-negative bacterial TonB protein C-terminal